MDELPVSIAYDSEKITNLINSLVCVNLLISSDRVVEHKHATKVVMNNRKRAYGDTTSNPAGTPQNAIFNSMPMQIVFVSRLEG